MSLGSPDLRDTYGTFTKLPHTDTHAHKHIHTPVRTQSHFQTLWEKVHPRN